jgi:hypothetical protein
MNNVVVITDLRASNIDIFGVGINVYLMFPAGFLTVSLHCQISCRVVLAAVPKNKMWDIE